MVGAQTGTLVKLWERDLKTAALSMGRLFVLQKVAPINALSAPGNKCYLKNQEHFN